MKRIYTIPDLPDTLASRCKPNDLIPFAYDQNGCMYRWGVPFKNFEKLKELSLNQPYKIADLQSLDCIVLDRV